MLTNTITRLDVPAQGTQPALRDLKVVSHAYGRVADFVMECGRGTEVWDVDGTATLTLCQASPSMLPVTATPMSSGRSRNRPRSSCTSRPTITTRAGFACPKSWTRLRRLKRTPASSSATRGRKRSRPLSSWRAFTLAAHSLSALWAASTAERSARSGSPRKDSAAPRLYADPGRDPHPLSLHLPANAGAAPDEEDYGETVVNYLKKTVFKSLVAPEDVAAIVVEPIQGEGGYVVPPPSFFPMLREVCDVRSASC